MEVLPNGCSHENAYLYLNLTKVGRGQELLKIIPEGKGHNTDKNKCSTLILRCVIGPNNQLSITTLIYNYKFTSDPALDLSRLFLTSHHSLKLQYIL